MQNQLQDLNDRILISTDQNGINSYLSDFNEILSNVCIPFFKTYNTNSSYQYDENRENPWFNEAREEKRYIFLQKLNIFRANKDAESRMAMTRQGPTIRKQFVKLDMNPIGKKHFVLNKLNLLMPNCIGKC